MSPVMPVKSEFQCPTWQQGQACKRYMKVHWALRLIAAIAGALIPLILTLAGRSIGEKNIAHMFPIGDSSVKFDQVAEYKPLTFWSKVSLGTSYFTNTSTANNIEIVYAYRPDELKATNDPDAVTKLLKAGMVQVGVESKDKMVSGYRLPDGVAGNDKAPSEFVKTSSAKGDIVYLAPEHGLLGATPSGTLYSTGVPQWPNH